MVGEAESNVWRWSSNFWRAEGQTIYIYYLEFSFIACSSNVYVPFRFVLFCFVVLAICQWCGTVGSHQLDRAYCYIFRNFASWLTYIGSHGGSIYTMDIGQHYKSGPPPHLSPRLLESWWWNRFQHTLVRYMWQINIQCQRRQRKTMIIYHYGPFISLPIETEKGVKTGPLSATSPLQQMHHRCAQRGPAVSLDNPSAVCPRQWVKCNTSDSQLISF